MRSVTRGFFFKAKTLYREDNGDVHPVENTYRIDATAQGPALDSDVIASCHVLGRLLQDFIGPMQDRLWLPASDKQAGRYANRTDLATARTPFALDPMSIAVYVRERACTHQLASAGLHLTSVTVQVSGEAPCTASVGEDTAAEERKLAEAEFRAR